MSAALRAWLASQGLEQLAELLIENEVDLEALPELGETHLKELGIALGPRVKLLKAIAGLRAAPRSPEPDAAQTPSAAPATARAREAERRQLTVMFVDLVGSTALSQRLDPEEMRDVLRVYQNTVAGEISRLDGFTAKLMGDGVLAYFGWPKAHEHEAERAVRSGLAIVAAVAKLSGGGEKLSARVGIATGLVVVGDLAGEGAAQEQAVVGDTPNLAARLQGLAEPGTVVIAEATRRLLGDVFALRTLGAQSLKGIAEPVPAYAVLGERALESRFASRAGETVAPMVGRDEELALLMRQWREAVAGEGRAVLVVGEAGIGKSRLIRALREAVLPDRPTVLLYQCSPSHADSPLWPVMQQLAFAARFEPGDDTATRRAKLAGIVADAERRDLLASLLGIPGDAEPLAALLPQERRRRTLQALVEQLGDLAARAPVLVLMEDVHWIDPSTIELLQRILEAIASRPVLVVLTSRPEAEPALGSFPHLSRLVVSRLGRTAVEAMVGRLLEARALDAEVRAQILARTDGVPLFVEELTKAVLEASPAGKGITVPATLQDSLLARLDRDPLMKSVAQIAACIGREFDHALLAAIADLAAAELSRGLDALVTAELVYRRGTPPDASYAFKHALVRDTAYESLLKSRRRTLHGRIAEALAARSDSAPELLALHFTAAGQIEPALDHWERAGRVAIARSAPREAVAHLGKAIALLERWPDGEDRLVRERRLQAALGGALVTVAGYGAAATRQAFARAYALAGDGCEPATMFPILMGQLFGELAHDVRAMGPLAA
ncbi:MAG: hypothetical protein FJX57_13045, partial [Alphaproteobacteria bacterium]|nr:hypothetical protein [Alphaproteobacteria bacterium]